MKFLIASAVVSAMAVSPVEKVVGLLTDLEAKIQAQGVEAQKNYEGFAAQCHDTNKQLGYDIQTGKNEVAELKATIAKESNTVETSSGNAVALTNELAKDEGDLKAATEIRAKEAADFAARQTELRDTIGTLERAIAIIAREAKGGASMLQLQNARSLAQALSVLVQASSLSAADGSKLTAMIQSSSDDEDAEPGAPDAAIYKSHSGGIIDTLETLLAKARGALDKAVKAEQAAIHNFQLLKQSLHDQIRFGKKDIAAAKKTAQVASGAVSTAQGNLDVTSADVAEDQKALASSEQDCEARRVEHEAAVASRAEELKALAEAKAVVKETTGGAASLSYSLAQSFLQTSRSRISSHMDLANFEVVHMIRHLAQKTQSESLTQLASRVSSAIASGSGDDVFAKVKGLITQMLKKLEAEAGADATHKAYCDKEMAESTEKSDEHKSTIDKLTAQINLQSAQSQQLKEQVATLQQELAELAKTQANMNELRAAENKQFVSNKADMEKGLEGVKMAIKVLGDYYATDKAHDAAEGASSGIISLLEVIESDFSKGLAEMVAAEEAAAAEYTAETKENAVVKVSKQRAVKYQTKEAANLDKSVAGLSNDLAGEQSELDAVSEYLASLQKECITMPLTYAERKSRRDAELQGLKEALAVLENETAFLQKRSRRHLRG